MPKIVSKKPSHKAATELQRWTRDARDERRLGVSYSRRFGSGLYGIVYEVVLAHELKKHGSKARTKSPILLIENVL